MNSWVVTATVPATVFDVYDVYDVYDVSDVYDVYEVLDALVEFSPMLDGGTVDAATGRRRPWRVTIDVPAPHAHRAATTGVRVVEVAFGRRVLGFDVVTHAEHEARTARAVEALRTGAATALPWPGPCVP